MECVLSEVYKKHKTWLDIVQSFSVNKDTAADIVSEMYINVQSHLDKNTSSILYENDEINYYFVFIVLRNLVYDLKRKEKKVSFVGLEGLSENEASDYIETPDLYNKVKAVHDWYENKEYLEMLENETMLGNFSSDKMHLYYLRRIFKEVYLDGKKLAKFSRESKITYWSLRNTLKIIKKQIRDNYENRDITRDYI